METRDHWYLGWYKAYRHQLELDAGGFYPFDLSDERFLWGSPIQGVIAQCSRQLARLPLEWAAMTEEERELIRLTWLLSVDSHFNSILSVLGGRRRRESTLPSRWIKRAVSVVRGAASRDTLEDPHE
jgi:hypothetical protein